VFFTWRCCILAIISACKKLRKENFGKAAAMYEPRLTEAAASSFLRLSLGM
jgi:hypothetical protein